MSLTHPHAVVPNSLPGWALHYLSPQWPKLVRYVGHGAWPIDNNHRHAARGMTEVHHHVSSADESDTGGVQMRWVKGAGSFST